MEETDNEAYSVFVEYEYLSQRIDTMINSFLFVKPKVNDVITIRINPNNPSEAVYYGKKNLYFYFSIFLFLIIILAFIYYSSYYFKLLS